MHDDEFDSELGVDAALQRAYERFSQRIGVRETPAQRVARELRAHDSVTACYQIIDPATARSIENAATWAMYGPEFSEWAERMRDRGQFSEADIKADPR